MQIYLHIYIDLFMEFKENIFVVLNVYKNLKIIIIIKKNTYKIETVSKTKYIYDYYICFNAPPRRMLKICASMYRYVDKNKCVNFSINKHEA